MWITPRTTWLKIYTNVTKKSGKANSHNIYNRSSLVFHLYIVCELTFFSLDGNHKVGGSEVGERERRLDQVTGARVVQPGQQVLVTGPHASAERSEDHNVRSRGQEDRNHPVRFCVCVFPWTHVLGHLHRRDVLVIGSTDQHHRTLGFYQPSREQMCKYKTIKYK